MKRKTDLSNLSLSETRKHYAQQHREKNEKLVVEVVNKTRLRDEAIRKLMQNMKLRLDTKKATNLLVVMCSNLPQAVYDAVTDFNEDPNPHGERGQQFLAKRFLRILTNKQAHWEKFGAEEDLTDLTRSMPGMVNEVDDEISRKELQYQIGDLSDEY